VGAAAGADGADGANCAEGAGCGGGAAGAGCTTGAEGAGAACAAACWSAWIDIAVGGGHTCAVNLTNETFCWGANTYGQSGVSGATTPVTTPHKVLFTTAAADNGDWRQDTAGGRHTCGSTGDKVWCWGYSGDGV